MRKPRRFKNYGVTLCSVLFLALVPASAQTLVYSTTMSSTDAAFSYGFSLPAFDTNMGTLLDITLAYNISSSGSVTATAQSNFTGFGGFVGSQNSLSSPNVGPGRPPETIIVQAATGGGFLINAGDSTTVSGSGSNIGTASIDPVTYVDWQSADGGTLDFNLTANAPFSGMSPGPSYSNLSLSENGTFTLTYTYLSSVPEPSTTTLLGLALGMSVLFQAVRIIRFRRQSA